MDRAQKEEVVAELGQIFADSGVVVVAHYAGITVAEMTDFRNRMREAGGGVRVAKNKLAKIALEGKPCASMASLLQGGLDLSPMITHRFSIDDYKQGFEVMASGQSGKVILSWE